jgi:hypothetical protein
MNIMTPGVATASADIGAIAESTSAACISTRVRQLSRIVTRVYDDALRPLGITASQFTLTQLAQQTASPPSRSATRSTSRSRRSPGT